MLLAEDEGQAVGTLRLNLLKDGPFEFKKLYDLEKFRPFYPNHISMTTKFMIKKEYRNSTLAGKFIVAVYLLGKKHNIKVDFIDTNPHLINDYIHLGYPFL